MHDSMHSACLADFVLSGRNCPCIPSSSPGSLMIAASAALVVRPQMSPTVCAARALSAWAGGAAPVDHHGARSAAVLAAAVLAGRPAARRGSSQWPRPGLALSARELRADAG